MNIRPLQERDHEAVRIALWKAVGKSTKKWVEEVDLPTAYSRIISGEYQAFLVEDTYLILADVVTPWYTKPDTLTLSEMLVLRVYDGPGKFKDIPRALSLLAGVVGAGAIVVGTALANNSRALQRMYMREGFQPSAVELYKLIKE